LRLISAITFMRQVAETEESGTTALDPHRARQYACQQKSAEQQNNKADEY